MSGPRPVFLLSLPRSGSTLLQRMLGAHSAVSTAAEPWVLISPLYAIRVDGVYAEYSHKTSAKALQGFAETLPGGRDDYLAEVREMALRLYDKASEPGARYFLDKTPRYSLVVDELFEMFPDARVIFLWRNPLAVVASIVDTWFGGRWVPHRHKIDLFTGLEKLVAAQRRHRDTVVTLRYEDLVADPRAVLTRVLAYLDLPWEEAVGSDLRVARVAGSVGDRSGTQRYQAVSADSVDRWKATIGSPVRKAWCRRYLDWIGDERLAAMGYDHGVLREEVRAVAGPVGPLPRDLWDSVKGTGSLAIEPRILRHKLDRLPSWRTIHVHT